ncbi:hypothetical protein ACTFIZ_008276 [Dictyostelium cf. discoideum]
MYRSDKGFHFISSQLIVCLETQRIVDVVIGKGRNNDPGLANKSATTDLIVNNGLRVLGDSTYSSKDSTEKSISIYKREHAALRSLVERSFKLVKDHAACSIKQKSKPWFHACVCCNIIMFYQRILKSDLISLVNSNNLCLELDFSHPCGKRPRGEFLMSVRKTHQT